MLLPPALSLVRRLAAVPRSHDRLPSSTLASSRLARACTQAAAASAAASWPLTQRGTSSGGARAFSTTRPVQTKTIKAHLLPSSLIPPYPYGERRIYKQSNRGLYGSARLRHGNIVTEKHKKKSPRFFRPNVHVKVFDSPSIGARIKTRLTLRVLKTITREGGIENYLLKSKAARIKELGPGGWRLRWLLMQTQAVQHRFNEQRLALGLKPKEVENRDHIIQYALDRATPGPLNSRSRATIAQMRADPPGDFEVVDASVGGPDAAHGAPFCDAEELLIPQADNASSHQQEAKLDEQRGQASVTSL